MGYVWDIYETSMKSITERENVADWYIYFGMQLGIVLI